MVTTEASAVYVAGDPQWCMAGYTPADDPAGGTYCTAKFTKFTGVGGLIEELTNGLGIDAGPGTIYISYDYDTAAAGDDIDHITFDYGDVSLTDLVVQGGWDFAQNKVVGTSTISLGFGFSLEFLDWGGHGTPGSLTLKDIIITNGNGLFVGDYSDYTTADVALENVDVIDTEYGAYIETEGNVEITDSGFNNSKDDGLFVYSYLGDITLTRVWSEDNFGDGAYLETCDCGSGNIFVESSAFVKNGGRGLVSYASGNITIKNIYAELNEIGGVELDNCAGFFFSSCTNTNPATITMSGTKLILENGNNLVIPCPMEGSASLTDHSQDDLPGSLPDGTTFKSAFVSAFSDEVSANGKLDKYVLISFVIPEGVDPSALVILFWDGAQWVEVKGAFVRNEDGTSYFEAYVDYAGIFVLAQK